MDSFSQMHIFFLISTLGFIILFILVGMLLLYAIRSVYIAKRILEKVEKNIDHIGDTAKDMLEDLRDNIVFKFLFGRKKKRGKY